MPPAPRAVNLRPHLEEAPVRLGADVRRIDRLPEARPAGAGIELGVRGEEGQATGGADIDALLMVLVERRGPGPLRALLAQDAVLLRSEDLLPLGVRLLDLPDLWGGFHGLGSFPLGGP